MNNKIIILTILSLLSVFSYSQQITLISINQTTAIASNGVISPSFQDSQQQLDCGMPQLFIYPDRTHTDYRITTSSVIITSVESQWLPITSTLTCSEDLLSCEVSISNQCNIDSQQHQINRITLQTSIGTVEYLVDCSPNDFYKPLQIGLFLLIVLSTAILTLSSLYSKAWSYNGYGYSLTYKTVIAFNILLLAGIVLGYLLPHILSFIAQVFGTIVGAAGVAVCANELLWLVNSRKLRKQVCKKVRVIDLVSGTIGLLSIPLYWLLNGQWIVNDIMAICSIVAFMKLLKIQSLSLAVFLLISLLILETLVGVVVHYVLKLSYNNYIINLLQNPIVLVMPSITRQLYRNCAWLPISSILFPGLVLSYLRRFDHSRGTFLYFLIGLIAFYFGSIIWMIIDLETVHSLPFAIISEPITIIVLSLQSYRRNQFKILWKGTFHDEEYGGALPLLPEGPPKQTEIVNYAELTHNIRMSAQSQSSDSYQVVPIDNSKM